MYIIHYFTHAGYEPLLHQQKFLWWWLHAQNSTK